MQNQKPNPIDTPPFGESVSRPVLSRPSLREAVSRAEEQIESFAFPEHDRARVRELCFIIAEVYLMAPDAPIRISGENLDGYLVRQVFEELRNEHVRLVLDNFRSVTDVIKYKKAYLRAALYHSVFELESHYANLVNHNMAGGSA